MRRYLLGQLQGAEEDRLELQLLTNRSFSEEFDTVVDEITDQYVKGEFRGDERDRVEEYFLRSPERKNKVKFACELLYRASVERDGEVIQTPLQPVGQFNPGLFERTWSFLNRQSYALPLAATASLVVIIVIMAGLMPQRNSSPTYASLALSISNSNRGVGAETTSVKLEPGSPGIRIELTLPDQTTQANSYSAELVNDQGATQGVPVTEQNAQSVIVVVPRADVPRGSYALRLYAVDANGAKERIRGSYLFRVE